EPARAGRPYGPARLQAAIVWSRAGPAGTFSSASFTQISRVARFTALVSPRAALSQVFSRLFLTSALTPGVLPTCCLHSLAASLLWLVPPPPFELEPPTFVLPWVESELLVAVSLWLLLVLWPGLPKVPLLLPPHPATSTAAIRTARIGARV